METWPPKKVPQFVFVAITLQLELFNVTAVNHLVFSC